MSLTVRVGLVLVEYSRSYHLGFIASWVLGKGVLVTLAGNVGEGASGPLLRCALGMAGLSWSESSMCLRPCVHGKEDVPI